MIALTVGSIWSGSPARNAPTAASRSATHGPFIQKRSRLAEWFVVEVRRNPAQLGQFFDCGLIERRRYAVAKELRASLGTPK